METGKKKNTLWDSMVLWFYYIWYCIVNRK